VVLPRREDVEADLLGLAGNGDGGLDALILRGGATGRRVGGHVADGEDAELHSAHSLVIDVSIITTTS